MKDTLVGERLYYQVAAWVVIFLSNFQLSSCDKTSEPGLGLLQKAENWDLTQSCHQRWESDPWAPGGWTPSSWSHHSPLHQGLTYTQLIRGKKP